MRHRIRGRILGRSPSHRKAMLRNMAASLIRTVRVDDDEDGSPAVPGRIVTTLPKAKELRPFVEKLITMAKKAAVHAENAAEHATTAERNSTEWKTWRESESWQQWNQAMAPALAYRRRAFSALRDNDAVDILFDELADRFRDRPGGYTRVVELAERRLGDAGKQALIEFVGERDRVVRKRAPVVVPQSANADQSAAADAPPMSEASDAGGPAAAEADEDQGASS